MSWFVRCDFEDVVIVDGNPAFTRRCQAWAPVLRTLDSEPVDWPFCAVKGHTPEGWVITKHAGVPKEGDDGLPRHACPEHAKRAEPAVDVTFPEGQFRKVSGGRD